MPYVGRDLQRGNYLKLDDISSSFNGSLTTFNLTSGGNAFFPGSAFSIIVSLGGVVQEPESAFQIDKSQIIFATAPTSSSDFFCIALGVALGVGVPGHNTVGNDQLAKPLSYGDYFRWDSANNRVGINTLLPSTALDVVGSATFSGNVSIGGTLTYEDVANIDAVGIITARAGIEDKTLTAGRVVYTGTGGRLVDNSALTFNPTTLNTPGLNVTGVSTFSSSLSVTSGNIIASDGGVLINGAGGAILYLNDSNDNPDYQVQNIGGAFAIKDGTNNAERLKIDSGGRLLLNTSTEGHSNADDLTIATAASGSLSNTGITIRSGTTHDGNIFFSDATSGDGETVGVIKYNHGDNYLKFDVNNSEALRIISTGLVQVGSTHSTSTYSWDARLKVAVEQTGNDPSAIHFGESANGSANPAINFIRRDGSTLWSAYSGQISYDTEKFVFATAANAGPGSHSFGTRMVIKHNGRVGINSTAPSNTLVVQEPTDNNPSIKLFRHSTGGDIANIIWATNSGSQAQINYRGGGGTTGMQFYTGGTAFSNLNMIIDTNGDVGIGTVSPTRGPLHIHQNSTGDCQIHLTNQETGVTSSDGFTIFAGGDAGPDCGFVNRETGGAFEFYTHNGTSVGERLRIKSDGNVKLPDNAKIELGGAQTSAGDFQVFHDGNHNYILGATGDIILKNSSSNYFKGVTSTGAVELYCNSTTKLSTSTEGITVTGEVAASQDYPNFKPTLDFNFASSTALDPRITYSRSGPASFLNEDGKIEIVGPDIPRFDHDPTTREPKGLLVEHSRTNMFAGTRDMGNSGKWSPGGTVTQGANVEGPDGTLTAFQDVYNGANGDANIHWNSGEMTTSNSTVYTMSVFAKIAPGSSYLKGIRLRTYNDNRAANFWIGDDQSIVLAEGSSSISSTSIVEYPNDWYRCTMTFTSGTDGNQGFQVYLLHTGSSQGAAGYTLNNSSASGEAVYFWGAQLEQGSYVTSYIPTYGLAVTRNGDVPRVNGKEFDDAINLTEGTFIVEYDNVTNDGYILSLDDGNNKIGMVNSNSYQLMGQAGGASQGTTDNGTLLSGTNRFALAYKTNDAAISMNGNTATVDISYALPTPIYLWIGHRQGQYDFLGSAISRLLYYNKRLPNSQLKTLSTR